MTGGDALWLASLDDPDDDLARKVLADKLEEGGFGALAASLRDAAGRALTRAAADPPRGDLLLRLLVMDDAERLAEVTPLVERSIIDALNAGPLFGDLAALPITNWAVESATVEVGFLDFTGCQASLAFTASGEVVDGDRRSPIRVHGQTPVLIEADGAVACDGIHLDAEGAAPAR